MYPPVAPRPIDLVPCRIFIGLGDIDQYPLRTPSRVWRAVAHSWYARLSKRDNRALYSVLAIWKRYGITGKVEDVSEVLRMETLRHTKLACHRERSISDLRYKEGNIPNTKIKILTSIGLPILGVSYLGKLAVEESLPP